MLAVYIAHLPDPDDMAGHSAARADALMHAIKAYNEDSRVEEPATTALLHGTALQPAAPPPRCALPARSSMANEQAPPCLPTGRSLDQLLSVAVAALSAHVSTAASSNVPQSEPASAHGKADSVTVGPPLVPLKPQNKATADRSAVALETAGGQMPRVGIAAGCASAQPNAAQTTERSSLQSCSAMVGDHSSMVQAAKSLMARAAEAAQRVPELQAGTAQARAWGVTILPWSNDAPPASSHMIQPQGHDDTEAGTRLERPGGVCKRLLLMNQKPSEARWHHLRTCHSPRQS